MAEIIVLGAGMVGVSSALALQERGHTVTILDRTEPGLETSYGNAGIIQREAVEPYAMPRDLPTLILYGLGRTNDIVYHLREMPRLLPSLWSYFNHSAPTAHRKISKTYAQLAAAVTQDHAPLIEAAKVDHLIRRDGFYTLCRNERAMAYKAKEADYLESTYAVPLKIMNGTEIRAQEKALKIDVAGAIHWTDSWSTSDPGALTAAYAKLFVDRGGAIVSGDAQTLQKGKQGWTVKSSAGSIEASDVVVALGPWSPDLLKSFGYQIPMVFKRGYHGHFKTETPLTRPMQDFANGVLLAPMSKGMRIATGAELTERTSPMNPKQLLHGLKSARQLMEVGEEVGDRWLGHRPCMPDMLPVVGEAPKHKGLWFHFGHGHQGLTMGPTTAKILAAQMEGEKSALSEALAPANRPIIKS